MTQSEYKQLVKKAIKAREAYYVLSQPIMKDSEYDALEREIERVESMNPSWVMPTSPTQTVGFSYSGGSKMGHKYPMLSVKKAYGFDELDKACAKMKSTEFCVEWKYDGISCALVYEDGELVQAGTRGDGVTGRDITDVVWGCPDVPNHINASGRVEIRGEVVMTEAVYEKYFSDVYPDGRNAASTIAQSQQKQNGRYLTFRAWQGMGDVFCGCRKQSERIEKMIRMGFKVSEFHVVQDADELHQIIDSMTEQAQALDVYVDGIVIKVNDMDRWLELGATKTSPKYAVAYKWQCTKVAVKVTEIEMRTAASGRVTPIVWFAPTQVDGQYFDHVSGCSVRSINEKGVKVGCYVEVGVQGGTSIKLFNVVEKNDNDNDNDNQASKGNYNYNDNDNCSGDVFFAILIGLLKGLGIVCLACMAILCAIIGVNFQSAATPFGGGGSFGGGDWD